MDRIKMSDKAEKRSLISRIAENLHHGCANAEMAQKKILPNEKKIGVRILITVFLLTVAATQMHGQTVIELRRGRLWHSFHRAQEVSPMYNWSVKSYGMDWPGYEPEEIDRNLGGTFTYLYSGGFYVSALRTVEPDTVQGWMDFALNGDRNTSTQRGTMPFYSEVHAKRWLNGENHYCLMDPNEAEEVIDSYWYKDPQYSDANTENKKFNIAVTRTVRQWSGSALDENYVIVEYDITSVTTENTGLDSAVFLFTYALGGTDRGWNYTNPNMPNGASNTVSAYDSSSMTVTAWAGDLSETPEDEIFDHYQYLDYNTFTGEYDRKEEFMAPGKLGIRLLEVSYNGSPLPVRFSWSAGSVSNDLEGPFAGVAGMENKYEAMKDLSKLYQAFDDPEDPLMGSSRLYANWGIGPFNLRGRGRGTLKVVVAEFIGGPDWKTARSLTLADTAEVAAIQDSMVALLSDRAEFNYKHGYRVPMPPPGPEFTVSTVSEDRRIGNLISFGDSSEFVNDPHQGSPDAAGYRIYRSPELAIGPWTLLADVPLKDPDYWNPDSNRYEFYDYGVALGYGYYYSVTAYDSGHASWAVDPSVSVPPLESSIYANAAEASFKSTLLPDSGTGALNVVVVPNPFYLNSGFENSGDADNLQFVNVPPGSEIRIFTLRGDLVKTIRHENMNSAVAVWNQISEYGQYVKSGMYFYHVKSPDGREFRGKFALVK